jgi:membrane protease YdiL (CAAX protease family)
MLLPPAILDWLDYLLIAAGAAVIVGVAIRWTRAGGGDPLRGSPIRRNTLSLPEVWICLTTYLLGWWIGGALSRMFTPPGLSPEELLERQGIFGAAAAQLLVITSCLLVARRAFPAGWPGLGLNRRPLRADLVTAVAAWLASLAICGLIVLATDHLILLFFPEFKPPAHTVFKLLEDPATGRPIRLLAIFGAALLAPIGEELLFRGILQSSLARVLPARYGSLRHRWAAVIVVGVIFGAMHSPTPQHIPALIAFGLILGFLYERTGSLRVTILVHMLFNGKSLIWYELQRLAS